VTHFLAPLLAGRGASGALVNARTGAVVASALELAGDSRSRRRGLLGRAALEPGRALVLAPCSAVHTWFMRFPIDVVFVARDGRVLKLVERLRAWRMAARFGAFAAIELTAGTLAHGQLAHGDRVIVAPAQPGAAGSATPIRR
jgi:uncharacterized membrane protein (UPF0127 family)